MTWSEPATLQRENAGSASLFVDKESITADPFDRTTSMRSGTAVRSRATASP